MLQHASAAARAHRPDANSHSDAITIAMARLRKATDRAVLARASGRLEAWPDAFDDLDKAMNALKALRSPAPVVGCAS